MAPSTSQPKLMPYQPLCSPAALCIMPLPQLLPLITAITAITHSSSSPALASAPHPTLRHLASICIIIDKVGTIGFGRSTLAGCSSSCSSCCCVGACCSFCCSVQRAAPWPQQVQRGQALALVCLAPVEQRQLRQRVWTQLLQRAPDAVDVERDGLRGSKASTYTQFS
jgi:hypothetical protein